MPKYPTSFACKSIYIDLKKLRKSLKLTFNLMGKADRITYGTPVLQQHAELIRDFVKSQEFKEEQYEYLKKFVGDFAVFMMDLDLITEENIIHFAKPKEPGKLPSLQREIFEAVENIDVALAKWKSNMRKGKTIVAEAVAEPKS